MTDLAGLIAKHRKNGILVDTNLLVLLMVGRTSKQRILEFKRTRSFTVGDYELLECLLSKFATLIATPHIFAEASNLADLSGQELETIRLIFRNYVEKTEERFEPSRKVVTDQDFVRLGIADAAIARLSSQCLVVTSDVQLYLSLMHRGVDAINFNHIRTAA